MKSTEKPPLRSRGFIGAKPASSVTAGTGPQKLTGPAKSRGVVTPNTTAAPKAIDSNIKPPGKWHLK
ncbi:hypothetical protein [Martelella endophytica]|uniref:Uncharacterized protein n=1 Tax=Martelella endophytica TaxID=1486262 RepID=A0A0D5LVB9_MAREN|nr:hypothetical protein [Martelella endophytica]AJY47712.1 hypothetical protein TM49_21805 [Martelella endophytica]